MEERAAGGVTPVMLSTSVSEWFGVPGQDVRAAIDSGALPVMRTVGCAKPVLSAHDVVYWAEREAERRQSCEDARVSSKYTRRLVSGAQRLRKVLD